MNTTDVIILDLIEYLRFINKIKNESDFATRIGMFRATLTKIKNGTAHFTVEQIRRICKEFNVNGNFILALSPVVFNTPNSIEIDRYISSVTQAKKGAKESTSPTR